MLGESIKCLHKLIKYKSKAGSLLRFLSTKINLLEGKRDLISVKLFDQTKYLGFSIFLSKILFLFLLS